MSHLLKMARRGVLVLVNQGKGFEQHIKPLDIISAEEGGKLKFQWTVDESQTNGYRTLHGGFIALAADFTTTVALMTVGNHEPGVSVDLSVSYMKAANIDDVVTLETIIKRLGSTLAFTEAVLKNQHGDILATARHTKFVGKNYRPSSN